MAVPVVAVVVVAVVAIIAGVALGLIRGTTPVAPATVEVPTIALETTAPVSNDTTGSDVMVEVPDVIGKPLEDASTLLTLAGFTVTRVATPAGESATGTVLAQNPNAGSILQRGDQVTLTYAEAASTIASSTANDPDAKAATTAFVVCIDPGHQDKANNNLEPIGPGSATKKAKVTGGATGAVTHQPEHDLVLSVSLKLKAKLEAQGVKVVMTRMTSAVDISNSQRAAVANSAGADLFIRVHADGSTNGDVRGLSTLYPKGNAWVNPISAESLKAATAIHAAVLATTGAPDRGVVPRADMSGFNYAKVPSVIVECGFLSNPVEDRLLATASYQDKLAAGMTRGIMGYLRGK
ncbi:MAG: N-acetylmuramoyl-L-alanine [Actinobacteria bacterium]|nr:MAG: N-acetylmuramoyl-L-alanine [Actinomycetota bacterium]